MSALVDTLLVRFEETLDTQSQEENSPSTGNRGSNHQRQEQQDQNRKERYVQMSGHRANRPCEEKIRRLCSRVACLHDGVHKLKEHPEKRGEDAATDQRPKEGIVYSHSQGHIFVYRSINSIDAPNEFLSALAGGLKSDRGPVPRAGHRSRSASFHSVRFRAEWSTRADDRSWPACAGHRNLRAQG